MNTIEQRCKVTRKIQYKSKAEFQAAVVMNKWNKNERCYECKFCGYFHRTSETNETVINKMRVLREKVLDKETKIIGEDEKQYLQTHEVKYDGCVYEFYYNYRTSHITILNKEKRRVNA